MTFYGVEELEAPPADLDRVLDGSAIVRLDPAPAGLQALVRDAQRLEMIVEHDLDVLELVVEGLRVLQRFDLVVRRVLEIVRFDESEIVQSGHVRTDRPVVKPA